MSFPPPERIEWMYDRRSSSRARSELELWAREQGIGGGDRDRLALALSEMVANAAEATQSPFHVEAILHHADRPALQLIVINEGRLNDLPDRSEWHPTAALTVRGHGLGVIEAVADEVEVLNPSPDTVGIAATFSLGS